MNEDDKKRIQSAIEDILWMAGRYAHGRHTYAPTDVRHSVEVFKFYFPDLKIKPDHTIQPPNENEIGGVSRISDYLHDIFNNTDGKSNN